jgi:hypothetical protein
MPGAFICSLFERKKILDGMILNHSFETRPGHRPGQVIGSWVRWVDQKKTPIKKKHITSYNATLT